jgi:prephenate dehydrogenase
VSVAGVKKIGKLVICGVGLIGGSFALALRQAGWSSASSASAGAPSPRRGP